MDNQQSSGTGLYSYIERLYPLCRSITGDGVRETLRILSEIVPIEVHEVPTGTPVLDWTVPNEWTIRDAWIKDHRGQRIVDFRECNLHVVSYSTPVQKRISRSELDQHLHSLPDHPDWIPYRTSYYHETWGFCVTDKIRQAMTDPEYEICIDADLKPGHLTYGELLIQGQTDQEVLISTHVCHPSLCNDNLSGVVIAAHLAAALADRSPRYSYRFIFIPGTIGSITWLARNRETTGRIKHGLTLVCLGDRSDFTYKRTIGGDAEIDRIVEHVLDAAAASRDVIDYFPYGYDERQFNSPGFRLPVGSLMRGRHGKFAEYHTSADNLDFVSPERLEASYAICFDILDALDANRRYSNLSPYGEPQLGRRGLYRAMGGLADPGNIQLAMLWTLALSDGEHTLLDIAERAGMPFATIRQVATLLVEHELLGETPTQD